MKYAILWCFGGVVFLISVIRAEHGVIIGDLKGQLGNQLFQIAATVSLALDNNAIPVFPDLINSSEFNIPVNYRCIFFKLNTVASLDPIELEYKEPYFHFTQIPYTRNMRLTGHFQSEKYFKHHKDAILNLFEPSEHIKNYLIKRYQAIIEHPKTVSIHIRMYHDSSPYYHPFVGFEYIRQAIEQFDKDSFFVVFSNDINFCKNELIKILENKKYVFIQNNNPSHIYDLYLMSMCKSHIISNSSFSWWGAYLNQNPGKIVIAPAHWFGEAYSHYNLEDLLPKEWRVL